MGPGGGGRSVGDDDRGGIGADYSRGMAQAGRGLGFAAGFVGITLGCFYVGRLIDRWLGTEPVFLIIGTIVGFVLGFIAVYYGATGGER
jgi:F0F1-type ATP synthase assembly protein I